MKSLSKIPRQLLIIGILLVFLLLAGLSFPGQVIKLQATPETTPTPTLTPVLINGESPLESGDTQGLILGAVLILMIILSGVLIQRIIQKRSAVDPE